MIREEISGTPYALMELIVGGFVSLFTIVGAAIVPDAGDACLMGSL